MMNGNPYFKWEAEEKIIRPFKEMVASPRFEGGMQAFSGMIETGIGAAASLGTGGFAAPIGFGVMAHGLDQTITGLTTAFTNQARSTVTEQLFQKAGMSTRAATMANDTLSIAGSMGGMGAIRSGQRFISPMFKFPDTRFDLSLCSGSFNSSIPISNRLAGNTNAAASLGSKLSAIEKAQASASRVRRLSDGRMRYYTLEVPASRQGSTRGASYVTEWNPITGKVRSWMETYNHFGQTNRVHPKMINGQIVDSRHYPSIGREK